MTELWPFRPLIGIAEKLEWFSEVMKGRTGEQRLSLRSAPRQVFNYVSHLDAHKFTWAKHFARRNSDVEFYVPVWVEQKRLGSLSASTTVLPFDTTTGDWREGSFLVLWQSWDNYVVCEIDLVEADQITLTAGIGVDLTTPLVIPVRSCIAKTGFSFRRRSLFTHVSAEFHVQDNINLIGISETSLGTYPEYEDLIVLTDAPLEIAEISENIHVPAEYIDNGFGIVEIETLQNYADFGQTISFSDEVGEELWNRRRFIHWIRGKQIPFWLPSFNLDLDIQAPVGAGSTTITVRSVAPTGFYIGKHIMIELKNGNRYFREITNASVAGDNDVLTIAATGFAFTTEDVLFISFLSKVRSNTDSFDMVQIAPNEIGMTVPVIEVPE